MEIEKLRDAENEVSLHLNKRAEIQERLAAAISALADIVVLTAQPTTTLKEIMVEAHLGIMKAKGVIK